MAFFFAVGNENVGWFLHWKISIFSQITCPVMCELRYIFKMMIYFYPPYLLVSIICCSPHKRRMIWEGGYGMYGYYGSGRISHLEIIIYGIILYHHRTCQ